MAIVEKSMPAKVLMAGGDDVQRRFDFDADTFAFANELVWEYRHDPVTNQTKFSRREPKPTYSHRCFVVVRSVRQFFFHARFEPRQSRVTAGQYRQLIRSIVRRNPRNSDECVQRVVIPGFANLRALSEAHPEWLKAECGGAWQSYILRSHWRMVLPISRDHQLATAQRLVARVRQNAVPIIHLVKFPALTINHGMVLYDSKQTAEGYTFTAYDPNDPSKPVQLAFDDKRKEFHLPPSSYWAGGNLDIIEIYRNWLM